MVSYDAIKQNSRLTQFAETKELVLTNVVPKVEVSKGSDSSVQQQLFSY